MNYNELYVFNTALDGKDIYGIRTFSDKRLTRAAVEVIKDIMIEKGYLENYETLTRKGVEEIRRIKQYKESNKYVCILNMVVGFVDDTTGILLNWDKQGEFQFSAIDHRKNVDILMEVFPELLQSNNNNYIQTMGEIYVNPRDLLSRYRFNIKTSFTISTENIRTQGESTKELFFESEGKRYYYDCITNLLHESNSHELVNLLRSRLEVI